MAKKNEHIDNRFPRYLKYFKGLLSGRDQHRLEKSMMQDKFEEEAFEGMSSIDPAELESDVLDLYQAINKRTREKKNRWIPLLKYAATAAILFTLAGIVYLVRKPGIDNSELARQTEIIDSSEIQVVKLPELTHETDSIKPKIAQNIEIKKQKATAPIIEEEDENPMPLKHVTITPLDRKNDKIKLHGEQPTEELSASNSVEYESTASSSGVVNGAGEIPQRLQVGTTAVPELSSIAYTQQLDKRTITVKGRVMDAGYEEPLAGVNVLVKGTTQGTVTDLEGNFSIDVPADQTNTLEFASVGYMQEEVEVENEKSLDIELIEDIVALDEVVVIGYGIQKKSSIPDSDTVNLSDDSEEQFVQIVLPKPIGGMIEFRRYIKQNIRYNGLPEFDKNKIVRLEIDVSSEGEISDIRVLKSPGLTFENEAIRLINEGPAWEAGTLNDMPADQEIILKIRFPVPE